MNKMSMKDGWDILAVLSATGYWVIDAMPWIASFLAAVYTAIRIYEWSRYALFGFTKRKETDL